MKGNALQSVSGCGFGREGNSFYVELLVNGLYARFWIICAYSQRRRKKPGWNFVYFGV